MTCWLYLYITLPDQSWGLFMFHVLPDSPGPGLYLSECTPSAPACTSGMTHTWTCLPPRLTFLPVTGQAPASVHCDIVIIIVTITIEAPRKLSPSQLKFIIVSDLNNVVNWKNDMTIFNNEWFVRNVKCFVSRYAVIKSCDMFILIHQPINPRAVTQI